MSRGKKVEQNKFVSRPMTALEIAEIVMCSPKHVSNKLAVLIRGKKAAKVTGYQRPAKYVFYEPVHDLFPATGLSHSVKSSGSKGSINYRRFCSDPFRLSIGHARRVET